jgi:hypothetical protein
MHGLNEKYRKISFTKSSRNGVTFEIIFNELNCMLRIHLRYMYFELVKWTRVGSGYVQ